MLTFCQLELVLGEMIQFIWYTDVIYHREVSAAGHVLLKLSCWMISFLVIDDDTLEHFGLEAKPILGPKQNSQLQSLQFRCQKIRWMNDTICTVQIQPHFLSKNVMLESSSNGLDWTKCDL